jgi:hypothetical protein
MNSAVWRHHWLQRRPMPTIYQLTDHLHDGPMARVPAHQITATVSTWLAELGAHSPLVYDLARAVRVGDWPATYAVGECLSVDVAIASRIRNQTKGRSEGTFADLRMTFVSIPDLLDRSRIQGLPGNHPNTIRFDVNGLAT